MEIHDLDWSGEWNRRVELRRPGKDDPELWNRKAEGFARRVRNSDFMERLIGILPLESPMRVLDVGCGDGSLTIPLSRRVREVTAMDYSSAMIRILESRIREESVRNVSPLLLGWYDDWAELEKKTFDFTLASRYFMVKDLAGAVEKLHSVTRGTVAVVTAAGETSWSGPVRRIVGREQNEAPDYIFLVNYLYSMGIQAEVRFIETESLNRFDSREEALAWMKLALESSLSDEEERRVESYLNENLKRSEGGWELPSRMIRWGLITWRSPRNS